MSFKDKWASRPTDSRLAKFKVSINYTEDSTEDQAKVARSQEISSPVCKLSRLHNLARHIRWHNEWNAEVANPVHSHILFFLAERLSNHNDEVDD